MNNMTIRELKDAYAQNKGYENWYDYYDHCKSNGFDESEIGYDGLIQFCSIFYVQRALEAAADNAKIEFEYSGNTGSEYCDECIDKQSILNAYPYSNIK
jgi:hypothetical protein